LIPKGHPHFLLVCFRVRVPERADTSTFNQVEIDVRKIVSTNSLEGFSSTNKNVPCKRTGREKHERGRIEREARKAHDLPDSRVIDVS